MTTKTNIEAVNSGQTEREAWDGDSRESRLAFRNYDTLAEPVGRKTPWQIWRDACAWQARAASPAPASPSGEDAAEQSAAPMADPLRAAVESMVCMLENGEWAEHASTYKAPGDKLAARLEAAITDLHNELSGDSEQAHEAVTELSSTEIEKGWHATFSTDNPFCPCNLTTFTKAVRWAEHAVATRTKE